MPKIDNPVFNDLKKVGLIKIGRLETLQYNLRNGKSPVFKDRRHKFIFLGKYLAKEDYYRRTYSKIIPNTNKITISFLYKLDLFSFPSFLFLFHNKTNIKDIIRITINNLII